MLPTKFRIIWQSGFRGEDFQKSTNQKQELPVVVAMFVNGLGGNEQSLQRTAHRWFQPNFGSFGQTISEEKIFQKSTNQKQEWPVAAMFANGLGRNEQSWQRTFHRCFLPSFGSLGQAFSEEKIFKNRPIRKKNCLWRPCLLIDQDIQNLTPSKLQDREILPEGVGDFPVLHFLPVFDFISHFYQLFLV